MGYNWHVKQLPELEHSLSEVEGEPADIVVEEPKKRPSPIVVSKSITLNVSEAAAIQMMAKTVVIANTPDIIYSFMCAVKRGFEGGLENWLSLVSVDFWTGRGVNPYEEVSRIKEESSGNGERQGVEQVAGGKEV
mgnify:FL=1